MAREDCISHNYARTIEFLKNSKVVITKADKGNITITALKVTVETLQERTSARTPSKWYKYITPLKQHIIKLGRRIANALELDAVKPEHIFKSNTRAQQGPHRKKSLSGQSSKTLRNCG